MNQPARASQLFRPRLRHLGRADPLLTGSQTGRQTRLPNGPAVRPVWLTLLVVFGWPDCLATAGTPSAEGTDRTPLVAAYDRFAPPGEIDSVLAGQLLIAELGCAACHETNDPQLSARQAPVLDSAGARLRDTWVFRYLLDPQAIQPGTTMPHVLASLPESQREGAARALADFIKRQQQPFVEPQATGANPVPRVLSSRRFAAGSPTHHHRVRCLPRSRPDLWTTAASTDARPVAGGPGPRGTRATRTGRRGSAPRRCRYRSWPTSTAVSP